MDYLHLKQCRDRQQEFSAPKLPRLLPPHHPCHNDSSALPLFAPEPTAITTTRCSCSKVGPNRLSADSAITAATSFSKGIEGINYFSTAQWEELQLQVLIFRYMSGGAAAPPQLLYILLNKGLIITTPPPPFSQSRYRIKDAMDPEPERCRRTDGKQWRCSRNVAAGRKFCDRHLQRRSRKPVEIPTPIPTVGVGGGGGGDVLNKTNTTPPPIAAMPLAAIGGSDGGGGNNLIGLSGPSRCCDLLYISQRSSEFITESMGKFQTQNEVCEDGKSGRQVLRHFLLDDWRRRSDKEPENIKNDVPTPGTCLSISVPGTNPSTSDFLLKLATGEGNVETEGARQSNWGNGWSTEGPPAEALRSSSTSSSSPTTVLLHQLRGSSSEASYNTTSL